MIEIYIKTDGVKVVTKTNTKGCTLKECSISVYVLESIKKNLLEIPFDTELYFEEK